MKNKLSWFEIATKDLERAKKFYTEVFGTEFQFVDMPGAPMYMFDADMEHGEVGGALVSSNDNYPSDSGSIIYFSCEDVAVEAARVNTAGGKLIVPKTSVGDFGFIAQLMDTEGNRIGLHSNK